MKRKEAVYKGLEYVPVYLEDTSLTSPDYFQISEFPTRLTSGKNLFKLRGHPTNLRVGGYLNIEVLDYNGNPIYHEVINFIDQDKSRVIAIYVYENTSPGDCTITLIAEAATINNQPVPTDWQGKANVRWKRTIAINPTVSNESEIIFEQLPDITVSEQVATHLDRIYSGSIQFPTYTTGTVKYYSINGQPAIELAGGSFVADMGNGTITVSSPQLPAPTPLYTPSTTTYTSAIKKILSPTIALLDTEYTVYSSQSISAHTYTSFAASTYSVNYEATPIYVATENSESFALLQLNGLDPATGDISRIKVFTNNAGTVGDWELTNDIELLETEIFVPSTASLYPDQSIGVFTTQSIINTYWEGHTYLGKTETTAPTLTWTTALISNAMFIDSSTNIESENAVHVAQIKSAYNGVFIATSSYKIQLDALGTRTGSLDPIISIYLSGSAVNYDATDYFNQELPVVLGKRIGELRVTTANQRFDDTVFSFETDNTGTASLIFVVESGIWQIGDVHVTTDNDPGYSPNYTRIKTLVPTPHKSDNQISFKVEYYNVAGVKSKQINYLYSKNWEGGNRYIDGDYSMLTGSLYVADSLQSGIAISGYKDTGFVRSLGYEGFAAGFPGFLIWSGSALSGSLGTKGGVPYSGVGLELYGDANNYFRYSTIPSELDVHTETFFLGDPTSQYISGSNGNLEISSSGFYLTAAGDVTASSFIAVNGSDVLFNSNSEFVDGVNIGRILYYTPNEITAPVTSIDSGSINGITSSIFQTFLLPGETRIQVSFTYELDNVNSPGGVGSIGGGSNLLLIEHYISTASANLASSINTNYNKFSDESLFDTSTIISATTPAGRYTSGHWNLNLTDSTSSIENRQGMYCQIRSVIYYPNVSANNGTVKLRNFVYRSSRQVGSSIIPPTNPVK
jgi:hypothetical protein